MAEHFGRNLVSVTFYLSTAAHILQTVAVILGSARRNLILNTIKDAFEQQQQTSSLVQLQ